MLLVVTGPFLVYIERGEWAIVRTFSAVVGVYSALLQDLGCRQIPSYARIHQLTASWLSFQIQIYICI